MLKKLRRIIRLINKAEKAFNSNVSWEIKYDFIFGLKINSLIREAGLYIEWCDPDTTYQEDVTAYMEALLDFKKNLQGI